MCVCVLGEARQSSEVEEEGRGIQGEAGKGLTQYLTAHSFTVDSIIVNTHTHLYVGAHRTRDHVASYKKYNLTIISATIQSQHRHFYHLVSHIDDSACLWVDTDGIL